MGVQDLSVCSKKDTIDRLEIPNATFIHGSFHWVAKLAHPSILVFCVQYLHLGREQRTVGDETGLWKSEPVDLKPAL